MPARTICLMAMVLGVVLPCVAENDNAVPEGATDTRLDRMAENSQLHYELAMRHYDHALDEMLRTQDIDMVEPVSGTTALSLACQDETADAYDVVRPLLLKFGADPRLVDESGLTALHYAAHRGTYAVVELLLESGAEVNAAQDKDGVVTPLYMAYQQGNTRVAELLRSHGAAEIEADLRRQLDVMAALNEISEIPFPEDVPMAEAMQIRLDAMASTLEAKLRESGLIKDLEVWLQMRPRVMEAVKSTPLDPSLSAQEYQQVLMQKVFAAIGGQERQ